MSENEYVPQVGDQAIVTYDTAQGVAQTEGTVYRQRDLNFLAIAGVVVLAHGRRPERVNRLILIHRPQPEPVQAVSGMLARSFDDERAARKAVGLVADWLESKGRKGAARDLRNACGDQS